MCVVVVAIGVTETVEGEMIVRSYYIANNKTTSASDTKCDSYAELPADGEDSDVDDMVDADADTDAAGYSSGSDVEGDWIPDDAAGADAAGTGAADIDVDDAAAGTGVDDTAATGTAVVAGGDSDSDGDDNGGSLLRTHSCLTREEDERLTLGCKEFIIQYGELHMVLSTTATGTYKLKLRDAAELVLYSFQDNKNVRVGFKEIRVRLNEVMIQQQYDNAAAGID